MKIIFSLLLIALLYSSCATICGGSKYVAHVVVNNRPNAQIVYQGELIGTGSARLKIKRKEANEFSVTIKEDGYKEQKFDYRARTFRGWALVGSILAWTVTINGVIVLPVGLAVDIGTGAFWKPNIHEKGVIKEDYKNFKYLINYTNQKVENN